MRNGRKSRSHGERVERTAPELDAEEGQGKREAREEVGRMGGTGSLGPARSKCGPRAKVAKCRATDLCSIIGSSRVLWVRSSLSPGMWNVAMNRC